MKIALIINNLSSGGAERHCVNLANGFHSHGYEVMLIALSCLEERKCFYLPLVNKGISVRVYKTQLKIIIPVFLTNDIRRFKPDIVYNFSNISNLFGTLIPRLFLGRSIIIVNSILGVARMNFKYLSLYRKACDGIICNSYFGKTRLNELFGYPANRTFVVYNPLVLQLSTIKGNLLTDTNIHSENGNITIANKIVIIAIGRIAPVKNQMELLHAWDLLSNPNNCLLLLIGQSQSSSYYSLLRSYISLHKLNNVYFTGEITDIERYYQIADLFIQTSISESLPNVLIESMAFGIPVIASDVGDTKVILEKYNHPHRLYKSGDINQLVQSIELFISNINSESEKISRCAPKFFIEDFSIDKRTYETENVFNQIMENR